MDYYTVIIKKIEKETKNVKTFYLDLGENKLDYLPGQFVTIHLQKEGKPWPRAYSLCSTPKETEQTNLIATTIKEYPNSYTTKVLMGLKENDVLKITKPVGNFLLTEKQNIVFIALGIGITPLISMIKHIDQNKLNKKFILLYSNKTTEDIIFKKEIEQIQNENFTYQYFITQEKSEYENTRINKETIKKYVPELENQTFYVCGPTEGVKNIEQQLKELNIPEEQIKTEPFNRPSEFKIE